MQFSNWSIYMQSSSTFGAEIKKLLASQKRDRFPVGPCRAGPGRVANLSRVPWSLYTQMKLPSLRSVVTRNTGEVLTVHFLRSGIKFMVQEIIYDLKQME